VPGDRSAPRDAATSTDRHDTGRSGRRAAGLAAWLGEDASAARVGLSFIPPGEPWRNGFVESFNARVRDECLTITSFWSLAHARVVITDWKNDYNHRRRHSSLGYQTPADYAAACTHR
jgi:transposase InsO family protein